MGMDVANSLHRSPLLSSNASSQLLACASSQFDQKNRSTSSSSAGCNKSHALRVNFLQRFHSSFFSARRKARFYRSCSFEEWKRPERRLRRSCSACFEDDSEEEYMKRLQELAFQCHLSEDEKEVVTAESRPAEDFIQEGFAEDERIQGESTVRSVMDMNSRFENSGALNSRPFPSAQLDSFCWPGSMPFSPEWNRNGINVDRIAPASLERKADCVGLPLSLRMLKRKQWQERAAKSQEGFGERLMDMKVSACCSIKRAFSSMVFMIRELQNYTLQMRQILSYGDLNDLLGLVQREMHASFVWLFEQVFSSTPSLMVSVMILLANFTVYSMGNNVAVAATPPVEPPIATISVLEDGKGTTHMGMQEALAKFVAENPSNDKLSKISSPLLTDLSPEMQDPLNMGDGSGGSGGRNSTIAGGTEGDAHYDRTSQNRAMFSEDNSVKVTVSSLGDRSSTKEEGNQKAEILGNRVEESALDSFVDQIARELEQWKSFLKEASEELESSSKEEALDHETMQRFVAPVTVQLEPDNDICYDRTDLHYQHTISMDPDNTLLLLNYAQFLHLVTHDHDRAEEYYQRAMRLDPSDGEVIGKFANFLWLARGDLPAAEQAFLDAITADPGNPFHAGSYAHFLWNTGGEETCYPIA